MLLAQWVMGGSVAYLLLCLAVPMTAFSYFTHVHFASGGVTTVLTAGCCVWPAALLASQRHESKPLARPEWDAAVALAGLWGFAAVYASSSLINSPLTFIGAYGLLLLCVFDVRPAPSYARIALFELPPDERYWTIARMLAAVLLLYGPIVWSGNAVSSGGDFAWFALVLLSTPVAVALRSSAARSTNAEIAAGNNLRFPPIELGVREPRSNEDSIVS
jgi:hypothetical protein